MRAVDVHFQAQATATWLAQSIALRERIRVRCFPPPPAYRASAFVEVVLEWEGSEPC